MLIKIGYRHLVYIHICYKKFLICFIESNINDLNVFFNKKIYKERGFPPKTPLPERNGSPLRSEHGLVWFCFPLLRNIFSSRYARRVFSPFVHLCSWYLCSLVLVLCFFSGLSSLYLYSRLLFLPPLPKRKNLKIKNFFFDFFSSRVDLHVRLF